MWPFGQDGVITGYFLVAIVMCLATLFGAYRLNRTKGKEKE